MIMAAIAWQPQGEAVGERRALKPSPSWSSMSVPRRFRYQDEGVIAM